VTASSLDRSSPVDDLSIADFADLGLVTLAVSGSGTRPQLVVTGEIDSTTAPHVQARIERLLDAGARELTIDLTVVTFLDSAGLCALATMHRRASADGVRLRVLAASRAVVRPMQITGLWHLLGGEQVESLAS
jgi:anti-sigma B factor antagonist